MQGLVQQEDAIEQPPGNDLAARAKTDPEAFGQLYEAWYRRVFNYVFRSVMDIEQAEDLTGEIFFKVMRALGSFDPDKAQFSTWLYTIATRVIIDQRRSVGRDKRLLIEQIRNGNFMDAEGASPPEARRRLMRLERYERLHRAIAHLKPIYRQTVILFHIEERSLREVASITNTNILTVKARLFYARRLLRRRLQGSEGGEP